MPFMHPKYRKMLSVMKLKEKKRRRNKDSELWHLYILRCQDGSLYTGVTKDLARRFKMHNDGKASRYTRVRRPVEMIYHQECGSRTQALVRECAVKSLPKKKKLEIVNAGKVNVSQGG